MPDLRALDCNRDPKYIYLTRLHLERIYFSVNSDLPRSYFRSGTRAESYESTQHTLMVFGRQCAWQFPHRIHFSVNSDPPRSYFQSSTLAESYESTQHTLQMQVFD